MSLRLPTRSLRALLASALLLLGACASAPGIPETTWHRLPAAAAPARLGTPSALPIVVQRLEADGLHADQALLYALDPNGQRLRAYHYHLWVDPPGYLLQRRLIARLYAAGAAGRVTDQLSTRLPAVWVTGRIERFERVPRAGGGYEAHVGLRLRVSRRDAAEPLVEKEYTATSAAADDSLAASVQALGAATDQAFDSFLRDVGAALVEAAP